MADALNVALAAVNDIRVYADGIENALKRNKFDDANLYVRYMYPRLEAISDYIEARRGK